MPRPIVVRRRFRSKAVVRMTAMLLRPDGTRGESLQLRRLLDLVKRSTFLLTAVGYEFPQPLVRHGGRGISIQEYRSVAVYLRI